MDIKALLQEAGYPLKAIQQTKFIKPPAYDYAVWHDEQTYTGGDGFIRLVEHKYTIELYSRSQKREMEANVSRLLCLADFEFKKSEQIWLEDEQIYFVQYQFRQKEKVRFEQ